MDTNGKKDDKPELIYAELSYALNGICFNVQNELGCFARERQYGDAVEERLREQGLTYKREWQIGTSGNIVDFLIEDKIIVELKATRRLPSDAFRQLQNYLQQSRMRLGRLINFREQPLKPRRSVRIDTSHSKEGAS